MDDSLQKYPVSDRVKTNILDGELWKDCSQDQKQEKYDLNAYFEYYLSRTQRFSRDGGIHISINSHSDILKVARAILRDLTRRTIVSNILCARNFDHEGLIMPNDDKADLDRTTTDLCDHKEEDLTKPANDDKADGTVTTDTSTDKQRDPSPKDDAANATVDLCAGLLLMCEFGVTKFGFRGSNPLPWSDQQTLRQATTQYFSKEKALQPENPRLSRLFTARNLVSIGGMKVRWTSNLVDHLLLSDDDQTVFIFYHVGFLRHHTGLNDPVFPEGLAEETLRTLTLLFPQSGDRHAARRWLSKQMLTEVLDPAILQCGTPRAHDRRFEKFAFWHDRLVMLKQAFDESSPRGLRQWWNDRRNSVQWYNFWVAIMVFATALFIGLVQVVEGALQVYLSWKALQQQ
ncbi:hypothetical protein B0H66DRAFT_570804 [Apodospora peruviana]|uniref:Uncharacterized protein n=1 Tax=Apodospora peruviana TaxID=516989 RepID=A0AAE0HTE0_9PEZI|nr:hypothetical protein B0H66DRAFT_570804 [Apodospora peruviana]